jgi:ribosomal protein S18 acetylase RimI-like enzyme
MLSLNVSWRIATRMNELQSLCDSPTEKLRQRTELTAIINNFRTIVTTNIDSSEQTVPPSATPACAESPLVTLREKVEIRAVCEAEIDRVADIITHSFHFDRGWMSWFTPLFKLGIAEDLRHRLRSSPPNSSRNQLPQPVCSIAICSQSFQSDVVGTIELSARNASDRLPQNRYAYISNLAVSKDWRRRGVAQQLLLECEQIAKSWGYTELYLHVMADNERGRNLYQKLGYEVVKRDVAGSIIPWYRPERLFLCKKIEPKG